MAPSDRAAGNGAITAKLTPQPETHSWVIFFQDRRQPAHQSATTSWTNPHQTPIGSQPIPQGDPKMTVHSRTARSRTSPSQSVTRSCSSTSAKPQQWPFLAALFADTPPRGQRAYNDHLSWTKHLAEVPSGPTENRTTTTAVGGWRSSRSRWKNSGTAAHRTTNQRKENRAAW